MLAEIPTRWTWPVYLKLAGGPGDCWKQASDHLLRGRGSNQPDNACMKLSLKCASHVLTRLYGIETTRRDPLDVEGNNERCLLMRVRFFSHLALLEHGGRRKGEMRSSTQQWRLWRDWGLWATRWAGRLRRTNDVGGSGRWGALAMCTSR